jgi:spore germination protein GerM
MKEEGKNNRISSGVIAAVSAAVITMGGVVALYTSNRLTEQPPSTTTGQPNNTGNGNNQTQANEQTTNIYLLKDNGKNFVLTPLPVKIAASKDKPDEFLSATFSSLLTAKNDGDTSSVIPPGTKLLAVKVEKDTVRVNLSEQFTSGGGSASMAGRLGQVVYTATTLRPESKVYIEINGKQLDVLGGEGLELEQPLTRDSFTKNYQL